MAIQSGLSDDELRKYAPSIFATKPYHAMSQKYTFIPTIDVVNGLRKEGYAPFKAMQSKSRIEGKGEFTKHLIRFREIDAMVSYDHLGGLYPEVIVTNSHDGASRYKFHAGIYRFVCENGLMFGDTYGQMAVRHSGSIDGITEATFEIVKQFPRMLADAEQFSRINLTTDQQKEFAEAALKIKYHVDAPPIQPVQLLRPIRKEDFAPTLFNTFNVVQEHLLRGGIEGRNIVSGRNMTTRKITGINEDLRINQELWKLTAGVAKMFAN
jgi:Domain of unknown function (DUF932)